MDASSSSGPDAGELARLDALLTPSGDEWDAGAFVSEALDTLSLPALRAALLSRLDAAKSQVRGGGGGTHTPRWHKDPRPSHPAHPHPSSPLRSIKTTPGSSSFPKSWRGWMAP